jgi:hydroxymethylglutaryl-CoA lyase
MSTVQLVECPRDAMQGIKEFIPTERKVAYINALLRCGFHTLDCGSFVSAKAIPQMQDTAAVLHRLDRTGSRTQLSVIVANVRGAQEAALHPEVDVLGYPFSVSEQFQQRNTNASRTEALDRVKETLDLCHTHGKQLMVYLSMAFGNPYGEEWSPEIVAEWTQRLADAGVTLIMPSDTIGASDRQSITGVMGLLNRQFPHLTIGAHLHTTPHTWREKMEAAYGSGCRRFDSAIGGLGGCPMAKDDLTGNMPTERVVDFMLESGADTGLDANALKKAIMLAAVTFPVG